MGGEETMEVACATDKEPGEKQPRKESWWATMGPRDAPFGQSREESAGDDICGESRKQESVRPKGPENVSPHRLQERKSEKNGRSLGRTR